MNKKILGFSLVSSTLAGSISGVVSAENYKKEPFFSFPESCGIAKDVIIAINKAVSINNDICDFIRNNREKYNKKDRATMEIVTKYHLKLSQVRQNATEEFLKNLNVKGNFIFLPWYDLSKESFGNLFNFDTIVLDVNRKIYVDNFLNDFERIFDEIDYPGEIKKLAEDYSFYLKRVGDLRMELKKWSEKAIKFWLSDDEINKDKSIVEKELAIHFQSLNALKDKIEEKRNAQSNLFNQCNIF